MHSRCGYRIFFRTQLTETTSEAIEILDRGFDVLEEIRMKQAREANESREKITQANIQAVTENREDEQAAKKEEILLEGYVKSEIENQAAKNKDLLEQGKQIAAQTEQTAAAPTAPSPAATPTSPATP